VEGAKGFRITTLLFQPVLPAAVEADQSGDQLA